MKNIYNLFTILQNHAEVRSDPKQALRAAGFVTLADIIAEQYSQADALRLLDWEGTVITIRELDMIKLAEDSGSLNEGYKIILTLLNKPMDKIEIKSLEQLLASIAKILETQAGQVIAELRHTSTCEKIKQFSPELKKALEKDRMALLDLIKNSKQFNNATTCFISNIEKIKAKANQAYEETMDAVNNNKTPVALAIVGTLLLGVLALKKQLRK